MYNSVLQPRAAAIQAYDTALFNDTGFMVADTSGTSSSTALYPIETSTANLYDSDIIQVILLASTKLK